MFSIICEFQQQEQSWQSNTHNYVQDLCIVQFLLRDMEELSRIRRIYPDIPNLGAQQPPDVQSNIPTGPLPNEPTTPRGEKRNHDQLSSNNSTPSQRPNIYRCLDRDPDKPSDSNTVPPAQPTTPGQGSEQQGSDDDTSSEDFDIIDVQTDVFRSECID